MKKAILKRNSCQLPYSPIRHKKGFTLIELAIILVVIGILTAIGAGLIGILTKQAKFRESREVVKAVHESILGYVATNKKLPDKLSDLSVKTVDPYMNPLEYYRVNTLVMNNLCVTSGPYLTVTDNTISPPSTKSNVAFIIFSKGENGTNNTGTGPFTINEYGVNNYDDIAHYTDIDTLRKQVCTSFTITTDSLPSGTEEFTYPSTTLEATDGTTPYAWSIISGSLPPGLSLNTGTGVISGTPTRDGSYNFTVQVLDSDNPKRMATKSLSITIYPNKPRITTEFLYYGTRGQAYAANLSATGGLSPYTWNVSGLPAGLSLLTAGACTAGGVNLNCNSTTPCICGTPATAGTFGININITDQRTRTVSKVLSLTINPSGGSGGGDVCPALSLTPPSGTSWSINVGDTFNESITLSGGQSPYTNTQCTPVICNGLSLSCTNNSATISGIANASGTCNFDVSWQDSCTNPGQQSVSGTYTVNINPPPCGPFTGWASSLPAANNCKSYSGSITVVGGVPPYTWALSAGSLPAGINFCTGNTSSTCNLTGQALASPQTYNFTVQVQDSCANPGPQSTSGNFSITVYDPCYTTGVIVANYSDSNIWYSVNGIGCIRRRNTGQSFNVLPNDTYRIYTNNTCTGTPCATTYYCTQKGIDANNNCQTQITGNCQLTDR